MQFQYGEWLRAVGGRPRSPQRKTKPSGSEVDGDGHEHVNKNGGAQPYKEKQTAVRDEQKRNPSSIMICEKGNDVNHGSYPDFQQDARVTAGTTKTNKERGVIGEVAEVNHNLILKRSDDSVYLKGKDKNVNGADGAFRPKPKWTRIERMESGPVSSEENDFK